jgi:hypothetical protein
MRVIPLLFRLACLLAILTLILLTFAVEGARFASLPSTCLQAGSVVLDIRRGATHTIAPPLQAFYRLLNSPDERHQLQMRFNPRSGDQSRIVTQNGEILFYLRGYVAYTYWLDNRYVVYFYRVSNTQHVYVLAVLDIETGVTLTRQHQSISFGHLSVVIPSSNRLIMFAEYKWRGSVMSSELIAYSLPNLQPIKLPGAFSRNHANLYASLQGNYVAYSSMEQQGNTTISTIYLVSPERGVTHELPIPFSVINAEALGQVEDFQVFWSANEDYAAVIRRDQTLEPRLYVVGKDEEAAVDLGSVTRWNNYIWWESETTLIFLLKTSHERFELVRYDVVQQRMDTIIRDVTRIVDLGTGLNRIVLLREEAGQVHAELRERDGTQPQWVWSTAAEVMRDVNASSSPNQEILLLQWSDETTLTYYWVWHRLSSGESQLLENPVLPPFWQHDDETLFYIGEQRGLKRLVRVDATTGEETVLLDQMVDIIPSQYRVNTFVYEDRSGANGLDVYMVNGEREYHLWLDPALFVNGRLISMEWSGDQEAVVFQNISPQLATEPFGNAWQFLWANHAGTASRILVPSGRAPVSYVGWSPDSRFFAFATRQTGTPQMNQTIHIYNREGQEVQRYDDLGELFISDNNNWPFPYYWPLQVYWVNCRDVS